MSRLAVEIDNFVKAQVENGFSSHKTRESIIARVMEQDIDEKIAEARDAIKAGQYEIATKETNARLIAEIASEILPKYL